MELERLMSIEFKPRIQGFYKIEATNVLTGEKRIAADWFPNLITNIGLNQMGKTGVTTNCLVGSGNDIPSVFDTALRAKVAHTSSIINTTNTARSSPPYYGICTKTFRFAVGAAAGNLSEVGIGWNDTNCFSRALILDSLGQPTTITILPYEFLDIIYELRCYPPLEDEFFTLTLSGTVYEATVRASDVTSNQWAPNLSGRVLLWSNTTSTIAYSGPIGLITGSPTGSVASTAPNNFDYVEGSYSQNAYSLFDLNQANFVDGIKSFRFMTYFQVGMYQVEFDKFIPKNNTRTWRIDYGVTWARYE